MLCLPSAAARSASPPGGLLVTHHGMSRPRRWGAECGGALVLALTPVVDLAGPHGRQHLLSSLVTGLTGTELSLITQQMYREIKEQGYTGSSTAVGRFVAPLRAHKGQARSFKSVEPELATMVSPEEVKKKRPPTALQVAHWMTFKEEQRLEWQQSYLTQLCEKDSQIAQTYELIQEFTSMLREREGERLDEWLDHVEKQGVSELQSFANGLKKDYDAVKAGLTLSWSNGQTEGQVHRLKLIKRIVS